VTPPIVDFTRRGAELDLDAPATTAARRQRWRGPAVAAVAALLVSGAVGATLRTLTAAAPPPALPQAALTFVEAHLDGDTMATLGVTVHNAGQAPVTVASFEADGVRPGHLSHALGVTVPPEGTTTMRVTVVADCRRSIDVSPLRTQIRLADGTSVTAVPSHELKSAGGLCRRVRAELPDGWWDPWLGVTVEPDGENMRLTLPALDPGASLAGVWVGKTLLGYKTPPEPVGNTYRPLTLLPPSQCLLADEPRLPTGLRILLTGRSGLRDRYVVVGPSLARWLLHRC
jgi:hypothetical protein